MVQIRLCIDSREGSKRNIISARLKASHKTGWVDISRFLRVDEKGNVEVCFKKFRVYGRSAFSKKFPSQLDFPCRSFGELFARIRSAGSSKNAP